MKLSVFFFALLVGVVVARSVPESVRASQKELNKLKLQKISLSPEHQELLSHLEKLLENQRPSFKSFGHGVSKKSAPRSTGIYSQTSLSNANGFHLRDVTLVNVQQVLDNYFVSKCEAYSPSINCTELVYPIVNQVLPSIDLLVSLAVDASNIQSSSNTYTGNGTVDALLYLYSFPGADTTVNSYLSLLGFKNYPTTVVAYFHESGVFSANFKSGSLDFAGTAFSVLTSYKSIIEFVDKNNNTIYDVGEEVSTIDLSSVAWNNIQYNSYSIAKGVTVDTFLSSTTDGVVSIYCATSTLPVVDSDSQLITPNNTKCTLTVNNYPFTTTQSLLAVDMFISLTNGEFNSQLLANDLQFTPNVSTHMSNGYFSWQGHATDKTKSKVYRVHSDDTPITKFNSGEVGLVADIVGSVDASGKTNSHYLVFTFQSEPNPSFVYWDPSSGVGEIPIAASTATNSSSSTTAPSMGNSTTAPSMGVRVSMSWVSLVFMIFVALMAFMF